MADTPLGDGQIIAVKTSLRPNMLVSQTALGVSMVVYPPGSDTLPVRILTLMANGSPSVIAALCVILIGVTLLPLAAAAWWGTLGKRAARA